MLRKPLGLLGIFLIVVGIGYFIGAGVAYSKVQGGYGALQSFSEVQNVELSYNDDGQLVDRGEVEGGLAIRSLLEDDWGFPIVESDLDPNDPLVNSATEYMYQMATISYHTLHGTQTVVLSEADLTGDDGVATEFDCNGEMVAVPDPFPAEGVTCDFEVDGRYWTGFDRDRPGRGCGPRHGVERYRSRTGRRARCRCGDAQHVAVGPRCGGAARRAGRGVHGDGRRVHLGDPPPEQARGAGHDSRGAADGQAGQADGDCLTVTIGSADRPRPPGGPLFGGAHVALRRDCGSDQSYVVDVRSGPATRSCSAASSGSRGLKNTPLPQLAGSDETLHTGGTPEWGDLDVQVS